MELQDRLKIALAVMSLVGGLVAFYMLPESQGIARVLAVLGGALVGAGLFFVSSKGQRLIVYVRESVVEAKKVVWPTRKEASQMTGLVFAFVAILAVFMWVVDSSLSWLFYDVILKRG